MEREKKKKGRERERSEDQFAKRNTGNNKKKRKLLVRDVKQLNKNTNNNTMDHRRREQFDLNANHYDPINIRHVDEYNDDNSDLMPRRGRGVFDFPWLHEEENGSMFTDDINYNYIDEYYHYPFLLGYEEYYYGSVDIDACCSSTNAKPSTGQCSLSSELVRDNRKDEKYFVSDDSNMKNDEVEVEKMEYCIWSSVLDQPLDIGLFNKYL